MNECEIQLRLTNYLSSRQDHYDHVYVEYAVPIELLASCGIELPVPKDRQKKQWTTPLDFPWHNQTLYIDIVVEKEGKFAVVELKVGATAILEKENAQLDIFGKAPDGIEIMKEQGAQDEQMYAYWKDVRRIEVLTKNFPNVVGGVALIVANDWIYWKDSGNNPSYKFFSTHEGSRVCSLVEWWDDKNKKIKDKSSHPPFRLDDAYYCHWKETKIPFHAKKGDHKPFRYMMSVIPPESLAKQIEDSKNS